MSHVLSFCLKETLVDFLKTLRCCPNFPFFLFIFEHTQTHQCVSSFDIEFDRPIHQIRCHFFASLVCFHFSDVVDVGVQKELGRAANRNNLIHTLDIRTRALLSQTLQRITDCHAARQGKSRFFNERNISE